MFISSVSSERTAILTIVMRKNWLSNKMEGLVIDQIITNNIITNVVLYIGEEFE